MSGQWFVKATVSAQIEATTEADAAQELCNRLAHGVPDQYEVNTVDAMQTGHKIDADDEAEIVAWLADHPLGPGDEGDPT